MVPWPLASRECIWACVFLSDRAAIMLQRLPENTVCWQLCDLCLCWIQTAWVPSLDHIHTHRHTHSDTHRHALKHHPFESEEEELAGTDSVSPVLGLATAAAHVTSLQPMPKHSGLGQPGRARQQQQLEVADSFGRRSVNGVREREKGKKNKCEKGRGVVSEWASKRLGCKDSRTIRRKNGVASRMLVSVSALRHKLTWTVLRMER